MKQTQQCSNTALMWFSLFVEKSLGCYYKDGSYFTMECSNSMKIHIVSSTLGTSAPECVDNTRCCPTNNICTVEATSENLQKLMRACDGKQTCEVTVHRQKCPADSTTYTDFESVTYTCDTPQGEMTTQLSLISLSLVFTAPTTSTIQHLMMVYQ